MVRSKIKAGNNTSFKSLQLLFCADRAKHLEDEIEPALKKGKIVICDRYFFSTLAYGFAAGVDFHWLYAVNKVFRKPDLTIFIDISPDISLSRQKGAKRRVRLFERRESLGKVRAAYFNLAKRFGFRIVNGENTVNDTRNEVQVFVDRFMGIKEH
jgi:dTMP kinase